jgi:hypothetical protein
VGDPVRQQAPRGSVPLRRKQVAPVLANQPCAEKGSDLGATRQLPELGNAAKQKNCEQTESQRELVDPQAAEVDARTKTMPFKAQHEPTLDSDSLGIGER